MAERLIDVYAVDDDVEILLNEQWLLGRVVRHEFPGIWVQLQSGSPWFVTNARRVRQLGQKSNKGSE